MRVVALCDELARVARFHQELEGLEGVELSAVVCNNGGWRIHQFWAGVLLQLLKAGRDDGRRILAMLGRRRLRISHRPLNHPAVVRRIARGRPDIGLHAAGVIYRKPLLDAFRRGILNAHIGLLPEYRGRSVMEWSLLHGEPTGITVFFMDEGIDTGPQIVLRQPVPVEQGTVSNARAYLFSLDAAMYRKALERLLSPDYEPVHQAPAEGTRYYVMSLLLWQVVERSLTPPARG